MVPLPVVVGVGARDGVGLAGPDAEHQRAVVLHVDMAVVIAGEVAALVAEPDELSADVRGRREPGLERVRGRVRELRLAGCRAAVEGDGGVASGDSSRDSLRDRSRIVPVELVRPRVEHRGAGGVGQPPVDIRIQVVHGCAVGVGRCRRQRGGAPGGDPVVDRVTARQHRRVDRNVSDVALEVVARRLRRPPVEVVAADPPVAGVALGARDIRSRAHEDTVDEQAHPVPTERGHDLMPLPVVVRGGTVHGLHAAGVVSEPDAAGVVHVDVPVVARRVARVARAEADDLASTVRRGAYPGFDGVGVGAGDRRLRRAESGVAPVEGRGGHAGDRTARAAGHAGLQREVGEADVIEADASPALVERPVHIGVVRRDRVAVRAAAVGRGDRDGWAQPADGVVPWVAHIQPVGVGAAGCEASIDEAHRRAQPERGVLRRLVHRRGGVAVAHERVRQVRVVAVVGRGPRDPHVATVEGCRARHELIVDDRADLVGCDRGDGEARQPVLGDAVDVRELPGNGEVLVVAGDAPGRLALSRVGADDPVREPVEQARARVARPVVVTVRVGCDDSGRGLAERDRVVHCPRLRLREAADVAAVVHMSDGVHGVTERPGAHGVTVTVLDPDDVPCVGVCGEDSLEVAGAAEHVAGAIHPIRRRMKRDDGGIDAGVAHLVACRPRQRVPGRGVEGGEPVAVSALDVLEPPAGDELRPVEGQGHRVHDVVCVSDPVRQRTVGGVQLGEEAALLAVDGLEGSAGVDRRVGDGKGSDLAAHDGAERGDHLAGRGADRHDPVVGHAVDGGEVTSDVDTRTVRRRRDGKCLGIEAQREGVDEHAGLEVVGEEVVAGNRVDSRRCACRPCRLELTRDVDRIAHDGLRPRHAVDLGGGEGVGAHGDGGARVVRIDRCGVRCGGRWR